MNGLPLITGPSPICVGGTATLTINGGVSPRWLHNNDTNRTITVAPLSTTTYRAEVFRAIGSKLRDTVSFTVTVQPNILLSFTALDSVYCRNQPAVTLQGSPAGGVFSGPGVSGNRFNPAQAGPGTHTLRYTVTGPCGPVRQSQTVVVRSLPTAKLDPLPPVHCANGSPVALQGVPTGGVFSGAGVSGSSFDPALAGPGTHTIVYRTSNSCGVAADSQTVTVLPAPTAAVSPIATRHCINSGPVALQGVPAGGVFSGPGVLGSTFDPATAGIGTHSLIYTLTDTCRTVADTLSVTVLPTPTASFVPIAFRHCENSTLVALQGIPAGGAFSGAGVAGGQFDPAQAGVGLHTLVYTVMDTCGMAADSQTVEVVALPVVSFDPLAALHCINGQPVPLQGTPAGGAFTGYGITNGVFYPSIAGAGSHVLTYTIQDTCGVLTATQTVEVRPLAPTTISAMPTQFCLYSDPIVLRGLPAGGVFSGAGVVGSRFLPAQAGMGTHRISYTVTDSCGPSTAFVDVTVEAAVAGFSGLLPHYCLGAVSSVSVQPTVPGGQFFLNGTPVTMPLVLPQTAGNHVLSYVVRLGNCQDSLSRSFVLEDFTLNVMADTIVCGGQPIQLRALASTAGTTYRWFPAEGLDNPASPTPNILSANSASYTVTATSPMGCTATAEVNIGLYGTWLQPTFEVTPDSGQAPVTVNFSHSIPAGTRIQWVFSDGRGPFTSHDLEPQVFVKGDSVHVSLITNPGTPCADTLTRTLYITAPNAYLFVPNAFSPNGDGTNDEFLVVANDLSSFSIQLYDRWGQLVFQSSNPMFRWNGTFNGQNCPEDTYVYVIRYAKGDSTSLERSGTVMLLR